MPRPPPRIAKVVVEHRRPPNQKLRPKHREFINSLPCAACGRAAPSECAHVRITEAAHPGSGAGWGQKPADRYSVPLCGPDGCHARQHREGETGFWADLGVDPLQLALRLWTVTGDIEAGLRLVLRCHQAISLHRVSVTRVTPPGGT